MWCLIQVANHVGYVKPNFEGLAFKVWGRCGKYSLLFLLIISQISVFIGANIFIGEFLLDLFCSNNFDSLCFGKNSYLAISMVFCFFIILIPDLKKFQFISSISSVIILLTSEPDQSS